MIKINTEKKIEHFYAIIILLPLAIIIGPFFSDFIISLVALIFLINRTNVIIKYINKYLLLKIIFLFCFLNIINSLFSENILISLKSSVFYLRFPLFIIATVFFFRNNIKFLEYFFYGLLLSISIVSVDAIIQFFLGFNLLGFEMDSKNRISGLFYDEYILGSYLARITPIMLSLYFFFKNKLKTKLTIIALIISFIAIILSGERTSFLIISIFYLTALFLVIDISLKKKFIALILILITSTLIFSNFSSLKERYIDLTVKQIISSIKEVNYDQDPPRDDTSHLSQHVKHLKVSFQMFKEKPWFGYGNKMFAHVCFNKFFVDDGRCSTHPHNFAMQILVENGVIGISFYFLILFIFFKNFIFEINIKQKHNSLILLLILISFAPFLPSGNFYNNQMSIFLYIPVAIYLSYKEFNKNKV